MLSQKSLNLEPSLEEGQQCNCNKKIRKREKRKLKKKNQENKSPKDLGHVLVQNLEILFSLHARAKMS